MTELITRNCQNFFLWCRKYAFNKRTCNVWNQERYFCHELIVVWPFISLTHFFDDLLPRYKLIGIIRGLVNFKELGVCNSIKIEIFHRYFSKMVAYSDVYKQSFTAYKMKPKRLVNYLINGLVYLYFKGFIFARRR